MGKSIYSFGQSVFGQLISLINRDLVKKVVLEEQSDRYCKGFYTWDHLVSMLFSTFGGCHSLREISAAFLGLKGKMEHFGMKKLPRRSTLSEANIRRSSKVFEKIYHALLNANRCFLPDSRSIQSYGKEVHIIDSTTISLFQAILKCVGKKPSSGRSKGGIKVHTLIKADQHVPEVVWFSSASTNDIRFWDRIDFKPENLYVFDKAYIDYWRYESLTRKKVHFVTRMKENATYETLQELDIAEEVPAGVLKDEWIQVPKRKKGKILGYLKLRRVAYWDEVNSKTLIFLTNSDELDPGQIADLYKQRWEIETLFKQLKQNFPLKYFLGDNVNAITIQIWCTLIVNLLLTRIKHILKKPWGFSNIVSFVRLHLFNGIHLINFLNAPERDWVKDEPKVRVDLFSP